MNATILHGTDGSPASHWFPWLADQFRPFDVETWVPQLPHCDQPAMDNYIPFLLHEPPFEYSTASLLIGHSSGAVAILGLLEKLQEPAKAAFLVGSFKDDLGWPKLAGLFAEPLDYELIKRNCRKFVFVHSDNDPYCPLEDAQWQCNQLGGEIIVLPGQGHFSTESDPKYTQFPELWDLIEKEL